MAARFSSLSRYRRLFRRLFAVPTTAISSHSITRHWALTAVFLSYQPRCQRRQPLTTFPSVRSPAFLFCRPRPSARETTVSLQPRRPFFFLSRKKEKVGGKKKESFAYGKRRNAVRCLRRGKRRFILPTGTASLNPQCRKVGIAVMEHRRDIEDKVLWKAQIRFPFSFPLQCLSWKES